MKLKTFGALLCASGIAMSAVAQTRPDVLVIGSKENEAQLSGSGHFLDEKIIKKDASGDVMKLLKKEVPGVAVREEDGNGLVANIGFRGVNASRSTKVTLMEDSVLTSPAPYSGPASYYTPYMGRMSGLEVLKGSSQIQYGPSTTGGVINFISTPIPNKSQSKVAVAAGSFNEVQTQVSHGDRHGNFSYLLELATKHTDGFRKIQKIDNAEVANNDDTGHKRIEPMIKLAYDLGIHRFEFKYGQTEFSANESYTGLTDADFALTPYMRYAATRFDKFVHEHKRSYLRHYMSLSGGLEFKTTLYRNTFERNWYRLNKINGSSISLTNATHLSVLRGQAAGTLELAANARGYESTGIEQIIDKTFGNHQLKFGVRLHKDREKRYQWTDDYTQDANGAISAISRGAPGAAGNASAKASGYAVFAQDAMTFGKWVITPGARVESVSFEYDPNFNTNAAKQKRTITVINPGVGAVYNLSDKHSFFGGIHRGSSLPDTSAATRTTDPVDEEVSYNAEIGVRSNLSQALKLESTLFYSALRDLIAIESESTGGTPSKNIGKASSYGLEFKGALDAGIALGLSFNNPWYLTATYNKTEIGANYTNSSYLTGKKGNSLPFAPELQFTLGTGIEYKKFAFDISGTHVGKVYATGNNVESEAVKSFFTVDAMTSYQASVATKLTLSVQNLFDKTYMVSRAPFGARAGKPQAFMLGMQSEF